MADDIDTRFRLVGDEDTGVGIDCRTCDRGGAPIAYLAIDPRAYEGADVVVADGIMGLLTAADLHGWYVHGWRPVFNKHSGERFDRAAPDGP